MPAIPPATPCLKSAILNYLSLLSIITVIFLYRSLLSTVPGKNLSKFPYTIFKTIFLCCLESFRTKIYTFLSAYFHCIFQSSLIFRIDFLEFLKLGQFFLSNLPQILHINYAASNYNSYRSLPKPNSAVGYPRTPETKNDS